MLLAIDIGNTNLTFGLFDGEKILHKFRLTTSLPRTSDEFGVQIMEQLSHQNVSAEDVEDVIVGSVVPKIMYSLTSGIKKYLKCDPIIVGQGTKTGIRIATTNPMEVGADRIVDAVGAYFTYGGPVMVIDYGTATTYDLVTADGSFVAGVTAPGIRISAKALWSNAAKLPEIEIIKPESILAKTTITSMQAGLVYGTIGQTEYIIDKFREESGLSDMKVVATGGLGRIISEGTKKIDVYDPELTLQGTRLIYELTKAQGSL
ncbi:MAG: type III pantothenate kinase [Eubacterium sp.]|nr:type III pantothenate kinase [Eubacterium sp.]